MQWVIHDWDSTKPMDLKALHVVGKDKRKPQWSLENKGKLEPNKVIYVGAEEAELVARIQEYRSSVWLVAPCIKNSR